MKRLPVILLAVSGILTFGCYGQNNVSDPWVDYIHSARNPIVQRISQQEISENKTPAAVAYNFVDAILKNDFDKIIANSDYEFMDYIQNYYNGDCKAMINDMFTVGILGVLSWKPALENGHEVTVAFIQDESGYLGDDGQWWWPVGVSYELKGGKMYLSGENKPKETLIMKKIYITCSPSEQVGNVGFQDITRYGGTNVKALVAYRDGEWKVYGFK